MILKIPPHIKTFKHNRSVNAVTLRQILTIQPKTAVDVGAGDGFYGKVLKHFFPALHVTGVELTGVYVKRFCLERIYDELIVDDIVNVVDGLGGDLVIFGDVLEHLEKCDSTEVLRKAVENFRFIIVNSPVGFQPQTHKSLTSEYHRCGIDYEDFVEYNVLEYHTRCRNLMFNCLLLGNAK